MGINDLPKPGINFRATTGAGNFQRKLSNATRYGDLKNLQDNQKAIVGAVKKYQGVIRTKGGLNRRQRRDAWFKIKAEDKTVTKGDRIRIGQVLEHLGRGAAQKEKKPTVAGKSIKTSGKKSIFLTDEQIARNLRNRMARDDSGVRSRRSFDTQFAGGKVQTTSIGVSDNKPATQQDRISGTSADLYRQPTNYFQANKVNKPGGNLPLKAPPAGVKPLGL